VGGGVVVAGTGHNDVRADGASERWTTQLAGLILLVAVAGGLLGQGAYYPSVQRPVGLLIAVATLLGMVGRPLTRDDLRLLPVVPALALAAWAVLDGARVGVAGGSFGQALLLVGLVAVLVVCRRLGQEDRELLLAGVIGIGLLVAQVITVALLITTGLVVSIGGRVRRRSAAIADAHTKVIRLLHRITQTAAAGDTAVDHMAAEGLHRLLHARRVSILRRSPEGFTVAVDIGETGRPIDLEALTHLDREGRIPPGHHRVLDGTMLLPRNGVALDLVARQQPVGYLVIIPGPDEPADRTTRLAVATMANQLAVAATEQPQR
jgi:hypothetical protein